MKLSKHLLLSIILAGSIVLQSGALAPPDAETLATYSNAAMIVSRQIPIAHLQKEPIDDELAADALQLFLDSLDYDHSFFLQSDVDRFRARSAKLDDAILNGDLRFAFEIFDTFMKRMSNRVDYVDQMLEHGFDFDREEDYRWKRNDLAWPKDRDDWDEVWRRKIKNLYLGHMISDRLDEEEASNELARAESEAESEEGNDNSAIEAAETPEQSIRKRYEQILSVMNDNDAHWLLTRYISSFAHAMDPHSDFMSQRDNEDFNINMKKSLNGIGALLNPEDGAAKIVRLIPGGPAEIDGRLKPNDKIIAVAQGDEEPVDIRHWPLSRAVRLIRGEKGSKVVLSVVPASDITGTKVKKFELIRDEVKLEEQVAKGDLREIEGPDGSEYRAGIIRIPDFYADMEAQRNGDSAARSVSADVRDIIEGFQSSNRVDGIVIDLRNNGGGALNEAVDLTGLFIDSGPVVQVKSGSRLARKLYDADPEQLYKGPLIVLVNRLSASASEIFAAALQDYGRAVIVGDSKTHGKGTVQALLPLSKSNEKLGSLKLTTAGFYRIGGGSTQLSGVEPDIVIPSILDYMEVGEEHLPHALEFDKIRPAFYWNSKKLSEILPDLKKTSLVERSQNEQFQEYIKLLKHLGKRRESETISLKLEERLETARAERKMQELATEMEVAAIAASTVDADQQDGEESDEEDDRDLVLDETLQILSDLIMLTRNQDDPEQTTVAAADE